MCACLLLRYGVRLCSLCVGSDVPLLAVFGVRAWCVVAVFVFVARAFASRLCVALSFSARFFAPVRVCSARWCSRMGLGASGAYNQNLWAWRGFSLALLPLPFRNALGLELYSMGRAVSP